MPPATERIMASEIINHEIDNCEYPMVLSIACSDILLRTAIKIVLAMSPITAKTDAIPIHLEKPISSINSLAVLAKKAFSGVVSVGSDSVLNRLSICLETELRRDESLTFTKN